jgi:membrane-associated protease RseP (regulator of RpoE activity)
MPHELTHGQNRVAIVNSVIKKIFNPCKYWGSGVMIQPFCKPISDPVSVLFIASYCTTFVFVVQFSALFDNSVFDYSVCLFCSDTGIVFQVFQSPTT